MDQIYDDSVLLKSGMEVLKRQLKRRKMTYKDLSVRSHIPESSIKKIFTGRDCSVTTLLKLCRAADVDPSSLFELASKPRITTFRLSEEQEKYFAGHTDQYHMFIYMIRGLAATEAGRKAGLDATGIELAVSELADLGLVYCKDTDWYSVHKGALTIDSGGPLQRVLTDRVARHVIHNIPDLNLPAERLFYTVGSVHMSPTTYKSYVHELRQLHEKYKHEYSRDASFLDAEELETVSYVLAIAPIDTAMLDQQGGSFDA